MLPIAADFCATHAVLPLTWAVGAAALAGMALVTSWVGWRLGAALPLPRRHRRAGGLIGLPRRAGTGAMGAIRFTVTH